MEHIYRYWEELPSGREGYSVADITYQAEASNDSDTEWYGKERKTLQAAINDAKRYYKKNPEAYFSIYAHAILTAFYEDGTQAKKPDRDCARIGSLTPDGEYFDLCESADWLEPA